MSLVIDGYQFGYIDGYQFGYVDGYQFGYYWILVWLLMDISLVMDMDIS